MIVLSVVRWVDIWEVQGSLAADLTVGVCGHHNSLDYHELHEVGILIMKLVSSIDLTMTDHIIVLLTCQRPLTPMGTGCQSPLLGIPE